MAKQPPVLNSECSGEGDPIQPNRRTPHRPLRSGAPTSLFSPFQGHQSDEGGSSTTSTPRGRSISPYSPSPFANRSPHCMLVRRSSLVSKSSSGYFSFEVSPAPVCCDKATQTPNLPCLSFNHHLSAMAARDLNDYLDLRPEIWIARELRRIGDEFDALYRPRGGNPAQTKNSLRDYFQKDEPTTTSWGNSLQPNNPLRDYFQKTMATSTSLVRLESLRFLWTMTK